MKQIYSFRDRKAEALLDPWVSTNHQTAFRKCKLDLASDSNLSRFAADFDLVHLGTFDPEIGIQAEPESLLINLSSLVNDDEE